MILLGLFFNKYYIAVAKERVERIKEKYNDSISIRIKSNKINNKF